MADESDGPGSAAPEGENPFVVDDGPVEWADDADALGGRDPDALDGVRVRQLSALRRGTYRARSYCVVAIGFCAVAIAQLALMTVRHVRAAGWGLRPVGYVCAALAAGMAGAFFVRRAAELTRDLRRRPEAPSEPAPPDFSTLSDGSHPWKNLERMQNDA